MKKITGFTLAEVLITLTIIGVIAALTIPNLMQKWSDNADVAKVKEANSILSNALRLAVTENGEMRSWGWPVTDRYDHNANGKYCTSILSNYLKVAQNCANSRTGECKTFYMKTLQGDAPTDGNYINNYWYNVLALQNGMTVTCFPADITTDREYIESIILRVDINGSKGPNRYGWDIFLYYYKPDGTLRTDFNNTHCNSFQRAVSNDAAGCVKWVMKHGNLDYKYRDVSAEW